MHTAKLERRRDARTNRQQARADVYPRASERTVHSRGVVRDLPSCVGTVEANRVLFKTSENSFPGLGVRWRRRAWRNWVALSIQQFRGLVFQSELQLEFRLAHSVILLFNHGAIYRTLEDTHGFQFAAEAIFNRRGKAGVIVKSFFIKILQERARLERLVSARQIAHYVGRLSSRFHNERILLGGHLSAVIHDRKLHGVAAGRQNAGVHQETRSAR